LAGVRDREAAIIAAWFEQSNAALCIVERDGRLVVANAAARKFLSQRHGLAERAQLLTALDAAAQEKLTAALKGRRSRLVVVGGRNGAPTTMALVSPGARGAPCLVRLYAPGLEPIGAFVSLAQHFDLSPQQSRIGAELVRGRSVEQIARKHGIAVATVRSHLKGVFSKLGVSSQAALVTKFMKHVRL
jgi:DNA-binding CsgD family transcriptional regulator